MIDRIAEMNIPSIKLIDSSLFILRLFRIAIFSFCDFPFLWCGVFGFQSLNHIALADLYMTLLVSLFSCDLPRLEGEFASARRVDFDSSSLQVRLRALAFKN